MRMKLQSIGAGPKYRTPSVLASSRVKSIHKTDNQTEAYRKCSLT